jgi:polyphosphate kinase
MTMDPTNGTPYVNRELSLLAFQERVFALALTEDRPLLERVKFIAIVSSNLDEFHQVRVAGLLEQAESGVTKSGPDGLTPRQQLAAIHDRVTILNNRIDDLFNNDIAPALASEGINLVTYGDLDHEDRSELETVFEASIFPVLTPLAVDPSHPFPFISDLSLNLAVLLYDPIAEARRFARVKIPPNVPRLVQLADGQRFVPIEQIVSHHLGRLFGGLDVVGSSTFRVTRSADLAVEEEEAEDLLEAIESVLRYRQRAAQAVRLEIEAGISDDVLELLLQGLELTHAEVYTRHAPLGLAGLWSVYALDRPDLKDPPSRPTTQPRLAERSGKSIDWFAELRRGDIFVHYPYESFATSTGAFLAQAAADPDVLAIKQTLYRTSIPDDPAIGGEEAVVRTLIEAAEANKQVVVLVELKARFDEAANINWAKMLESAGVHVVYGVQGLKTHTKTLLVVRREGGGIRRYSHVGTGNFNPNTARIYEDMGLYTADEDIGSDLSELFNHLTGYARPASYRKLVVAPEFLRPEIVERIREQAALGPDGRILMKANHVVDTEIVDELYAASSKGCRIDLIVRGNCSVRAGVPGLSETISLRSIVGRFLEHSRIYRFGPPGPDAIYYIGSADMMQRNLNNRVEALVPVTDPNLKMRLEEVLEVELADDVLAWEGNPDGSWTKVAPHQGIDTHQQLLDLASRRARGDVDVADDAPVWEANPDGSWTIVFPNLQISDEGLPADPAQEWATEEARYEP